MPEKKHCPFCRAPGEKITARQGGKEGKICYGCTVCWARGPEADSARAALLLWNDRPSAKRKKKGVDS